MIVFLTYSSLKSDFLMLIYERQFWSNCTCSSDHFFLANSYNPAFLFFCASSFSQWMY